MTNQVAITMLKNLEQSLDDYCELNDEGKEAFHMAITALELFGNSEQLPSTHSKLEKNSQKLDNKNGELISRQTAIDALMEILDRPNHAEFLYTDEICGVLRNLPFAQQEIILCKDCKYWRRQTNYAGAPLSFGFCESDDMWRSLYGETTEVAHIDTDDNHYCSYAERRLTDE